MRRTPLSDYISKLIEEAPDETIEEFYREFLESDVGLILENLPDLEPGTQHVVTGGNVTMALVNDPEGNALIKVCADPEVFEEKYGAGINALMSGKAVIEMLLKTSGPKGLLVCSAASFHSYPIYYDTAVALVGPQTKKWWQIWK